jgi:hypothetical protein
VVTVEAGAAEGRGSAEPWPEPVAVWGNTTGAMPSIVRFPVGGGAEGVIRCEGAAIGGISGAATMGGATTGPGGGKVETEIGGGGGAVNGATKSGGAETRGATGGGADIRCAGGGAACSMPRGG